MRKHHFFQICVALIACTLTTVAPVLAQGITGSVTGSVMDPTGGVVPGAEVVAINPETGIRYTTITNDTGIYHIPKLPPATYNVEVEMPGFKKAVVSGLRVEVDSVVRRDVDLEVGELGEEVTVQAEAVQIETSNPDLGDVMSSEMIEELPVLDREFVVLARLTSGAQRPPSFDSHQHRMGRGESSIIIAGQREISTTYMFDGIPSNESIYGSSAAFPSLDAISEFKVQRAFFSGEAQGTAVINVITKSGTNNIRGSAWWFHRNDNVNARSFFDSEKPEFLRHMYGIQVGGPVVRDKLHWFFNYEKYQSREGRTGQGTVPLTSHLRGDFSDVAETIIDPLTGQAFPNNQIPESRFDPFSREYLARGLIPAPNNPGAALNFVAPTDFSRIDDKYIVRMDYAHSDKDRFFGRYSLFDSSLRTGSLFGFSDRNLPMKSSNAIVDWVHTFSPNLIGNAKAGLNRVDIGTFLTLGAADDPVWPEVFGIRNINDVPICNNAPNVRILGFDNFGGNSICFAPLQNDLHYIYNMNYTTGRHKMGWGIEVRNVNWKQLFAIRDNGAASFGRASGGPYSGSALADFLLGHPDEFSGTKPGAGPVYNHTYYFSGFMHDEIQLTQNFSLTLGLRYELFPFWYEEKNFQSLFDKTTQRLLPATDGNRRLVATNTKDFGPRFGFAWTPGGSESFVIRSSYGLFYDRMQCDDCTWKTHADPRNVSQQQLRSDANRPTVSLQGQFPDLELTDPATLTGVSLLAWTDPNRRNPYQQMWTMSLQKTLPGGMFGEVAYHGSHGIFLSKRIDVNRPVDPLPLSCDSACVDSNRPYPDYGWILSTEAVGHSYYHALQTNVRKPVGDNLTFIANYAWQKTLDWDSFDSTGTRNEIWNNPDKGRAAWDTPHRFSLGLTYHLPRFADMAAAARHVLGGWQLSGVTTLSSGSFVTPDGALARTNTAAVFETRPDRIADGELPGSQQTVQKHFDTAAFVNPQPAVCESSPGGNCDLVDNPAPRYGNSGRNVVQTTPTFLQDLGLYKNFDVFWFGGETAQFQFRTEFHNITNNANFSRLSVGTNSPSFGAFTQALPGRQIQLGLRLIW